MRLIELYLEGLKKKDPKENVEENHLLNSGVMSTEQSI